MKNVFKKSKRDDANTKRNSTIFIGSLSNIVFPVSLALWMQFAKDLESIKFWAVIIVIGIIQIWAYCVLIWGDRGTLPLLLIEYEKSLQKIRKLESKIEETEVLLDEVLAHEQMSIVWSSIQSHMAFVDYKNGEAKEIIGRTIGPMIDSAGDLFGFEYDEIWSAAVYVWEEDALRPLWWKRSSNHPAGDGEPRTWEKGEGHLGSAFMAEQSVCTPDALDQSTAHQIQPKPANRRDYDEVYRSFISAPVALEFPDKKELLGVLTITSNVADTFNDENIIVIQHAADVVAGILALEKYKISITKSPPNVSDIDKASQSA